VDRFFWFAGPCVGQCLKNCFEVIFCFYRIFVQGNRTPRLFRKQYLLVCWWLRRFTSKG
jgi:hypothetical protein